MIPYGAGYSIPDNTYYRRSSVTVDGTYPFTSNYDNRVYAIVAVVTVSKFVLVKITMHLNLIFLDSLNNHNSKVTPSSE